MFHERKMQYLKNVDSPQFSLWVQGHSATFQQRFACEPRRTLTFLWRASRAEAGLLAPEGHGGQSPTDTEGLDGQRWRGEQTARLHRRCAVHPKPGPAHPKTKVQRRKPQTSGERPRRGAEGPTDGDSRSDGVHKSSNKRRLNPAGRGLRKDPSLHRKTAPARRKRSRLGRARCRVSTGTGRPPGPLAGQTACGVSGCETSRRWDTGRDPPPPESAARPHGPEGGRQAAGRAGAAVATERGSLDQGWRWRPRGGQCSRGRGGRGRGRPCAVGMGQPAGFPAGRHHHWQPLKPERGPEPPSVEPRVGPARVEGLQPRATKARVPDTAVGALRQPRRGPLAHMLPSTPVSYGRLDVRGTLRRWVTPGRDGASGQGVARAQPRFPSPGAGG